MTNRSVRLLYKQLQKDNNITYIMTYRLNQDVLENLFGALRLIGNISLHINKKENYPFYCNL